MICVDRRATHGLRLIQLMARVLQCRPIHQAEQIWWRLIGSEVVLLKKVLLSHTAKLLILETLSLNQVAPNLGLN
jgi:hypothetical protein